MSKLDVSPELRHKLAQDIKKSNAEKKAKAKAENAKLETKQRGDLLKDKIEMDRLLEHDDKLYFEEVFREI